LEIDNPSSFARNVLDLGFYLWICSFYVAVVLLLEANRIAQDRSRRWAEADAAAKSAQLSALRFQLNPHFLFNTLNAVSSLVVTRRNEDAELMIERLSDFLRSTLASAGSQEHTLEDEVQLLEAYLDIELVRFGDRLRFEFAIPADLACARLPSLILQPLVENAVKYAVAPSSRPIQITVEARQEGHCLVLSVVDDGPNAEAPASQPGVRMGLENVTNRLLALYGERGALTCRASPAGFQVELRLPLTKLDERDARPQIGHLHSFEPQGS
jgi:LytS/YehU family sensor histidine kinase